MTVRKPRKMPKNQRAYPKKGKPRLVLITDDGEQTALIRGLDDIACPQVFQLLNGAGGLYVEADKLKKWRALRNPPTGDASA